MNQKKSNRQPTTFEEITAKPGGDEVIVVAFQTCITLHQGDEIQFETVSANIHQNLWVQMQIIVHLKSYDYEKAKKMTWPRGTIEMRSQDSTFASSWRLNKWDVIAIPTSVTALLHCP